MEVENDRWKMEKVSCGDLPFVICHFPSGVSPFGAVVSGPQVWVADKWNMSNGKCLFPWISHFVIFHSLGPRSPTATSAQVDDLSLIVHDAQQTMMATTQTLRRLAPNFADNLCRWRQGKDDHYEVWSLCVNDRKTGRGFRFRYALNSPLKKAGSPAPAAELWATVFDRAKSGQNFGLVRKYEIGRFSFDGREDFSLRLGDGMLSAARTKGSLISSEHAISWNLSFEPNHKTHHPFGSRVTRLVQLSSAFCTPNLNTRFTGQVRVDGREVDLDCEPGCQSHLWGRKRPDDWVWIHANAFDGRPDTLFEGLAARTKGAGNRLSLVSLFLHHRGEEHRFVRFRMREQWRRNLGIGFWTFSAMNARLYIEGAAQCRLRDMLQVEDYEPDREPLYWMDSEVANLKIRLFRRVRGFRWHHIETIAARATAHLEHATRHKDPNVRSGILVSNGTIEPKRE
jgi:hypothetical protein